MTVNSTAAERLKTIVERVERLNEDLAAVRSDIKEVMAEAQGEGFSAKIIRRVIKLRATDKATRQEEEALIALYMTALEGGGWDDPPAPTPAPPPSQDAEAPEAEAGEPEHEDTPAEAAAAGRRAAMDGVTITANPYPAGSQQRVAWDMAWCSQTGTDGMDIPDELKPGSDRK